MSELKLFHGDVLIGVVSNIAPEDNYEMSGDIALTSAFDQYKKVFEYLLANDGQTDGSPQPFDDSFYDGWCLVDENGARRIIAIPAIENGEVIWHD